jgi:hypothetical protein
MKARPRRGSVKLMLIFFAYHHFFLYEYVSCWLPFWGVGSVIGSGRRASAFYQNLSKLRRLVFPNSLYQGRAWPARRSQLVEETAESSSFRKDIACNRGAQLPVCRHGSVFLKSTSGFSKHLKLYLFHSYP